MLFPTRRFRAILCLAWPLALVPAAHAAAGDELLTVAAVEGRAEVERFGARHPLEVGESVAERDVVRLGDDSHLALRLGQGSVLELGPRSELGVEHLPSGGRRDRKSIFDLATGYLRVARAAQEAGAAPLFLYFSKQRANIGEGEFFFESADSTARVCVASGHLAAIPLSGGNSRLLAASACYQLVNGAEPESIARDASTWAGMRRNFSLNAPTSPEAELAANDPSAPGAAPPPESPPPHAPPPAAPADAVRPPAAASPPPATLPAPVPRRAPAESPPAKLAPPPADAKPAAAAAGDWAINVGSFGDRAPADKQAADLQAGGYRAVVIPAEVNGRQWYRVLVRGTGSNEAAQAQLRSLRSRPGLSQAWMMRP